MPLTVVISIVWSSVPVFGWHGRFYRYFSDTIELYAQPIQIKTFIWLCVFVSIHYFIAKAKKNTYWVGGYIAEPDIADWKMCSISLQCGNTEKAFSFIDCSVTHLNKMPSSFTLNTQTEMASVEIQIFISLFYANNELFLQNQSEIVLNN